MRSSSGRHKQYTAQLGSSTSSGRTMVVSDRSATSSQPSIGGALLSLLCDGLRVAASICFGVAATRPRRSSLYRRSAAWRIFACFVGAFGLMLVLEVLFLPSGRLRGLPGSVAAPASLSGPVRVAAEALSALSVGLGQLPERPEALRGLKYLPNISVVMPCYGHVAFQEEAIASVVHQEYPPAEILVVDDGSEDHCGEQAQKILTVTLAAPRRRQVELLMKWWGFGPGELAHFRDEVIVTPNRGVAHARNTGIRRARGDWVVCLDADDMVSAEYFSRGMQHVAASPGTNLIYANQQFFYESRWQCSMVKVAVLVAPQLATRGWSGCVRRLAAALCTPEERPGASDPTEKPRLRRKATPKTPISRRVCPSRQWTVPELRVDDAIVRGPLPVMTLWRRDLWEASPHGFDEALPKGHEDWAFWLQLTRLPLQPFKIDAFLTQYAAHLCMHAMRCERASCMHASPPPSPSCCGVWRGRYRFKRQSKMRDREKANPEVPRLMRTLFADLYPVRQPCR